MTRRVVVDNMKRFSRVLVTGGAGFIVFRWVEKPLRLYSASCVIRFVFGVW